MIISVESKGVYLIEKGKGEERQRNDNGKREIRKEAAGKK